MKLLNLLNVSAVARNAGVKFRELKTLQLPNLKNYLSHFRNFVCDNFYIKLQVRGIVSNFRIDK